MKRLKNNHLHNNSILVFYTKDFLIVMQVIVDGSYIDSKAFNVESFKILET